MPATTFMAPDEYDALTPEEVLQRSNGCGPQAWKLDLVPDELLGIEFSEPCRIHDVEYGLGKDKALADSRLGGNLILACLRQHPERLAEFLPIVDAYVLAVASAGDAHFGKGDPISTAGAPSPFGWKTIAGTVLLALAQVLPSWMPESAPLVPYINGAGALLGGIGIRVAIAKKADA